MVKMVVVYILPRECLESLCRGHLGYFFPLPCFCSTECRDLNPRLASNASQPCLGYILIRIIFVFYAFRETAWSGTLRSPPSPPLCTTSTPSRPPTHSAVSASCPSGAVMCPRVKSAASTGQCCVCKNLYVFSRVVLDWIRYYWASKFRSWSVIKLKGSFRSCPSGAVMCPRVKLAASTRQFFSTVSGTVCILKGGLDLLLLD
jgi:uncharacterized Fe-S cluster protein YjdI